MGVALAVER